MKTNDCKHDVGKYSRSSNWFCNGCDSIVSEPEIPESVRKNCEDWQNLSHEDYCKKNNILWDGKEFVRTYKRLGLLRATYKYGFFKTLKVFLAN